MEREVRQIIGVITKHHSKACLCLITILLGLSSVSCGVTKDGSIKESSDQPPRITVKTIVLNGAPVIDGNVDSLWDKCPATHVPLSGHDGAEPREATIKAAICGDRLYIIATYAESTLLRVSYPWLYDGAKWTRLPHGDSLNILWNIDNSIREFNEKGVGVITVLPEPLDDAFANMKDTFMIVEKERSRSYFASQKADLWTWCATPQYYGHKADDMVFAIAATPARKPREIRVLHDAHDNPAPWVKNQINIKGQALPKYKYKLGFNIDNTPWAYFDQVEEITDWSSFQPGDLLPDVISNKGAVWGGSRDNINAMSNVINKQRTVEFERNLDTGFDDDVQFNLAGSESYPFIVAVYDGGLGAVYSPPVILELEK